MKTRLLIIIGVVMMTTIPFVTYTMLDWYSNSISQNSFDIDTSPKPGDKYYIEPERKAELEAVELDLRNKILQLHHQKNPLGSFAVNLDHLTKEIVIIVETEQFNTEIDEMISQYPDDIPIVFSSGKFGFTDEFELIPSDDAKSTQEHYKIEITGMKDIYRIGEQYDFSYIISGYGYSCGSKEITFPDQNGNTMKTISSLSCIAGIPMKDFVLDSQKQYDTTSVHGIIKIPGIYNVTVTFDRPSQDSPTTAIKEFRVPPINSWYNNQMRDTDLQTVIDSCANDSPKERMVNSLRYTNDTHVFMNLGCEWQTIGVFVGELENEN